MVLVHLTGRSEKRVAETAPIVKEVRQRALKRAQEIDAGVPLADTSPGTHCNVIQALRGFRKAYWATELTPFRANDTRLILEKRFLHASILNNICHLSATLRPRF